ncbi:MAG: hypothetical protein AB2A00_27220 [Myxococcota bacterium]
MGSYLLLAALVLTGVVLGALTLKFAPDAGWSPTRVRITAAVLTLGCVVGGALAFHVDRQDRVTTLHESIVEVPNGHAPGQPLADIKFVVEHDLVTHTLFFSPWGEDARSGTQVSLRVEVMDPSGRVVIKEERGFEARARTGSSRSQPWDAAELSFTPDRLGPHVLRLTPLGSGAPAAHVLIQDPRKTDGQRLEGF